MDSVAALIVVAWWVLLEWN